MGRTFWRYMILYVVLAAAIGGEYWARSDEADWWAYVDDSERGPWPKFKLHWPEQLVICGAYGMVIATPVTFAAYLAREPWRYLAQGAAARRRAELGIDP